MRFSLNWAALVATISAYIILDKEKDSCRPQGELQITLNTQCYYTLHIRPFYAFAFHSGGVETLCEYPSQNMTRHYLLLVFGMNFTNISFAVHLFILFFIFAYFCSCVRSKIRSAILAALFAI